MCPWAFRGQGRSGARAAEQARLRREWVGRQYGAAHQARIEVVVIHPRAHGEVQSRAYPRHLEFQLSRQSLSEAVFFQTQTPSPLVKLI